MLLWCWVDLIIQCFILYWFSGRVFLKANVVFTKVKLVPLRFRNTNEITRSRSFFWHNHKTSKNVLSGNHCTDFYKVLCKIRVMKTFGKNLLILHTSESTFESVMSVNCVTSFESFKKYFKLKMWKV